MMRKCAVVGILLAASTAQLFAIAEEDTYYVVRVPSANKCTIVDKRPAETPNLVIGDGHKTRAEAEAAMQKVCTEPAK